MPWQPTSGNVRASKETKQCYLSIVVILRIKEKNPEFCTNSSSLQHITKQHHLSYGDIEK